MRLLTLTSLLLLGALSGCASAPRTSTEPLLATDYSTGFSAACEVLRDYRFELERIDARHGVITTRLKPTAGLITPWDKEQTTTLQEFEELINQEFRVVRIEFAPPGTDKRDTSAQRAELTPLSDPQADLTDLRSQTQPLAINVTVNISRLHRPGRHPSTKSIRSSTTYSDPALVERQIAPSSLEELGRDEKLESRLLLAIEKQMASQQPATPASPAANPTDTPATAPAETPAETKPGQ